ncbi:MULTISPECIES: ParB N-terminal domain-containing protein [Rhizobium/Agrobacterium group]|uniref:Transcriptional regulator protein n=2 Tax=Rhizobium/Agrobacterium group TaxID=227290 RepID=B9JYF5_ALLAM|nr:MULTISPECIES: ParB N-terminal domain-containing protein [Rhizobium/Agrobacterium group]ACM37185.1 transcriptional regulator protein [Allorhizobium ampelinum S4]MUO30036.1 transcriptional regulator [Agrobacterium vitis]MUO42400.1 transcriptional regulator [Agrobacterium vitis]MUP10686.1 transcriptional regulator [Agrobacterium vitis]
MAEFARIPLSSIHIGTRARPVDEDHALAIAASMAERGLINPITVRKTPAANKGATPYTLVAGGHRLRAAELNQWSEIDAIAVAADAVEGQLIELSENLYRNELSKLDRAVFVLTFRELWEEKNGKIQRGGDKKSKGNDCPLIFAPGKELSEQVQERLGFRERTYKYVTAIGQNLYPPLRAALRGTPFADDQSLLLKLAKKGPTEQAAIAKALETEPDVKKVLSYMAEPKVQADPATKQAAILTTLQKAWKDADDTTRSRFLISIGMMDDLREAAE